MGTKPCCWGECKTDSRYQEKWPESLKELENSGQKVPGGGGYSHIWAIQVCAAQQGMVFGSLTLELGIKIALSLWNRVYFISGLTLE